MGFDSEFVPTESKFVESGVSLMQLATSSKIYLLDYMQLRQNEVFIDFLVKFMESPKVRKVGHTFSSDLQYLSRNFPKEFTPTAVFDIAKLFK